jgi:phosphoglycerate dehydrogenase-like enzyme
MRNLQAPTYALYVGSPLQKKMDLAPELKLIAVFGSGYNHVDIQEATKRGIYVTNARGGNAIAVAELTVAYMLNLARKFCDRQARLKDNIWDT